MSGLVVKGRNSRSRGLEFESRSRILKWHLFVVKIALFDWKVLQMNVKEAHLKNNKKREFYNIDPSCSVSLATLALVRLAV